MLLAEVNFVVFNFSFHTVKEGIVFMILPGYTRDDEVLKHATYGVPSLSKLL